MIVVRKPLSLIMFTLLLSDSPCVWSSVVFFIAQLSAPTLALTYFYLQIFQLGAIISKMKPLF